MRRLHLAGRAAALWACAVAAAVAETSAEDQIERLMEIAAAHHPALRVALARRAEAAAENRETEGFWDPRISVETGYADRSPAMPLLSPGIGRFDRAAWFAAGVEAALAPGLYGGVGASYRDSIDGLPEGRALEAGMYIRIPLWRDRGSALWRAQCDAAQHAYRQRDAELLAVWQDLRRDVELQYIDLQGAFAQLDSCLLYTSPSPRDS